MLLDARPRRLADVEADVESVGLVELSHCSHQILGGAHHLAQGFNIDIRQIAAVFDRRDHRVPGRIGIQVEECKRSRITPQGEGCGIVRRLESAAKNAFAPVSRVSRRYVLEPPWGEEDLVHRRSLLKELFPEKLSRLEVWDLFGWHVDLLPGFRVAAGSLTTLSDPK